MADTIHKAKDASFKLIFDEPELFVEFLHNYIPIDILKEVTPADIEDMSERFLPLYQDSKDSDTVKRINLKGEKPVFVIAILEHESQVNFKTSFKMLQYITMVLADYEKEANKENPNASSLKDFRFPPVLPIVFYDGAGEWTAETNFLDRTELSGIFEKYIPKFEYELVELNKYDEQDITSFGNALSLIMLIDRIKPDGGMGVLRQLPADYIESLKQNIPPHLYKILADVITVLLRRINVPDNEIHKVTDQLYERRIQEMFPFFENYDVQETRRTARAEGRAEGNVEGKLEGKLEVARSMLAKDMSLELTAEITGLSLDELKKLYKG